MAHWWRWTLENDWRVEPASAGELADTVARLPLDQSARPRLSVLAGDSGDAGDRWLLLTPSGVDVRVNGLPVTLGIRGLRDRDEVLIAGQRLFFSEESLVAVTSFPGLATGRSACGRCRRAIAIGAPAVRCVRCGVWCHQEDEQRECWTYAPTCPACDQPTSLSEGYRWTPAAL